MASVTTNMGLMRPDVEAKQTPDEMSACVRETLVTAGAMDALERAVGDLEMRLYQVLMPDDPAVAEGGAECYAPTSPLHDAIRTTRNRIDTLENRLHALMARLTV